MEFQLAIYNLASGRGLTQVLLAKVTVLMKISPLVCEFSKNFIFGIAVENGNTIYFMNNFIQWLFLKVIEVPIFHHNNESLTLASLLM